MAIVPVEIRAEGVSYSVVVDADEARSRFSLPRRILSFFKGPLPSKKKKKKKLLDDVWVTAHGGELHAVMGESGSGKSTLLSVLLARTYAGELEGRVTYDGDTASPRSVRPVIKSVPQEAVLRGTNTAREILRLACLLMLPQLSRNRVERHVANLLTRLHLEDCGDVVVGDAFVKGLSGGQRRRLSIALELVTIPAALALDEPTSGLDSRSSLEVVKILRGLASDNCNVMCAIHSPSAATFALFDRVTLLWAGRVAFSGLVQRLDEYLVEDCGDAPWEQGTSLAEHALDVLADSGDVLCERWSDCARESAKGSVPLYVHEKSLGNDDDDDDLDARLASGLRSFWLLFADTLRATVRNPREGRFRLKAATVVSTLTAVCFLRLRNTQRWAYSRRGLLCVECLFLFLMSASPTSVLLVLEKSWIQHGHHNAHFAYPSYFLARLSSFCVSQTVYAMAVVTIMYLVTDLSTTNIGLVIVVCVLHAWTSGVFGLLIGSFARDIPHVNAMLGPVLYPCFLFSGFFFKRDQCPTVLLPLWYANFLRYGFEALTYLEFRDGNFSTCDGGASSCPLGPGTVPQRTYLDVVDGLSDYRDFQRNVGVQLLFFLGGALAAFLSIRRQLSHFAF